MCAAEVVAAGKRCSTEAFTYIPYYVQLGVALLPIFNIGLNGKAWSPWYSTTPDF